MPQTKPEETTSPSPSAARAQRLHDRAERSREDRARRSDPDDSPVAREGPVQDDESRIAREDALSTFVAPDEAQAARMGGGSASYGASEVAEDIVALGRELGDQVDERVDAALSGFREELSVTDRQPPRGFIYGSLYGAALAVVGFAAALVLTSIRRRP